MLGIVRAHKGALKVYSEPGKGTTFKIPLPGPDGGEDATRPSESSLWPTGGERGRSCWWTTRRGLIALGARMLEHLGFTVLTAADGLQAVELP